MSWRGKLDELGFAYTRTADGIEVHGKAAHAMAPEEGVNAIARLCIALDAIGVQSNAIVSSPRRSARTPTPRASSAHAPTSRQASSTSTWA